MQSQSKLQAKLLKRKISASRGRFIAIILIIMLGVLLFAGIKSSGPDLYHNAQTYFNKQQLSDVQVTSPLGVTDDEVATAQKTKNATVETRKVAVVSETKESDLFQIFSYQKSDKLNLPKLVKGRMPQQSNEITLDATADKTYQLGAEVTFDSAALNQQKYKVVGFVTSPLFVNNNERPATNVGNGRVDYFAYLQPSELKQPGAQAIYLKYQDLAKYNLYKKPYQKAVAKKVKALAKTLVAPTGVTNSLTTPEDLPGFSSYSGTVDRITVIGNVFPLFFFLIAILITFTTMTRMVEEERTQIGTFKALGYKKGEIALSYFLYAIIAAVIGIVLGVVIGVNTLPLIVMQIMQEMYVFTPSGIIVEPLTVIIASLLALLATVGAVLIVMAKELREKPAELMLPKAPTAGKRILLERITPLWRHFSFFQKISYRNLFRFKARMWMGIIGIAGGAGLILTGFGISNSIGQAGTNQYNDVLKYQAIVSVPQMAQTSQTQEIFATDAKVKETLPIGLQVVDVKRKSKKVDTVSMMVTDQPETFAKFTNVMAKDLEQKGAVMTDKLAQLLQVQVGDTVQLKDTKQQEFSVKVAAITKNYVGHYLYLSADYYQTLQPQSTAQNAFLVKTKAMSSKQEKAFSTKLLETKEVAGVNFISSQKQTVNEMVDSLGPIVLIFILLSGLLTFVVLYNLTNINISERIRELSTIKVLGFYDKEVTMYIVRENVILTIMGILLGVIFGNGLLWFILQQAMTDEVVFPLTISWQGYLTATVLTIVFTAIVMYVTHRKLKAVNMIDALKANE